MCLADVHRICSSRDFTLAIRQSSGAVSRPLAMGLLIMVVSFLVRTFNGYFFNS